MAQTIATRIRGDGPPPETYDEEIVYLNKTFDDIISKSRATERALERSRDFAMERSLRDLLFGRRSKEKAPTPLPDFLSGSAGTYVVAIMQLEGGSRMRMEESDAEIFRPVLRSFPGASLRTGSRAVTLLVRLPAPEHQSELLSLLEEVVGNRRSRYGGKSTIGVSEPRVGTGQISRGYTEALEALRHRALWGDRTVIHAGTTDSSLNAGFFSVQEGYELMSALRTLDRDRVARVLERLLEDKSDRYSVDLFNAYLLYLSSCIAEVAMEYKVEPGTLFGSSIFDVVIFHDTMEEKKRYLVSRCAKLVEALNNESRRYKRLSLELVLEYIETNFQSPLSLSIIADELGMSPSYLSSLIKKELGINYVTYLNRLRVEKAKALLLAKEWTIKRVGAAAGYDSEHTFIRNFKKYAGLRPSEYRNAHQSKLA
jgi:AraC-like DNA-binding protein